MNMVTDITNWRDPGHNTWGFQNVDKILQTDPISKGSKTSTLLSKLCTFHSFRLGNPDNSSLDLASFLLQTKTGGLVVLKNGLLVHEHYDRTNTETSIHTTFSMSKSVASLACGLLVGRQGKLDVNNLVSSYVLEVKGSSYENVTVRRLLDMQSGVNHDGS